MSWVVPAGTPGTVRVAAPPSSSVAGARPGRRTTPGISASGWDRAARAARAEAARTAHRGRRSFDAPARGHARTSSTNDHSGSTVRPQRQHVDEQAHDPFERLGLRPRTGMPTTRSLLPGEAMQQHAVGRQQGHEQRGLGCAPISRNDSVVGAIELHPLGASAAGHLRRSRKIGRQVQRLGCAVELPLPEAELPLEFVATEPLQMPLGEIAVADLELGQRRGFVAAVGVVERRHFFVEQVERPAVPDDVVRHEEAGRARLRPSRNRRAAEQRRLVRCERALAIMPSMQLAHGALRGRDSSTRGEVFQRQQRDIERRRRSAGRRRRLADDAGAQRRLAPHHLREGALAALSTSSGPRSRCADGVL